MGRFDDVQLNRSQNWRPLQLQPTHDQLIAKWRVQFNFPSLTDLFSPRE